jgi:hypothetical protein
MCRVSITLDNNKQLQKKECPVKYTPPVKYFVLSVSKEERDKEGRERGEGEGESKPGPVRRVVTE